jgi:L-fuconolactonase
MRVIDTHQHFWVQDRTHYPWLTEDLGPIFRDYTPADLAPQIEAVGVTDTIIVQASDTYRDTRAMLAQAEANEWVAGVVGWVPLRDPSEAARKLDEEWLLHPVFCGVRHIISLEADPEWLVRPDVLGGLKVLEERGVPFDVVPEFPLHLRLVPTVARTCERLALVVDHLGKPPLDTGDLSEWATQLRAAARFPNVVAKVSGLNTAVGRPDWAAEDIVPAIAIAIEAFGVDRLMVASNWPVSAQAGTYEQVWAALLAAFDILGLTDAERSALLATTAERVYRLAGSR